jgi:hypothetical protein
MKVHFVACCLLVGLISVRALADENEVSVSLETVDEESPQAVAAAKVAGATHATTDIAAGKFQILDYGLPPPELPGPARPRDEETGYPIYVLDNCTPTPALMTHVAAYNETMRKWHAAHKK